MESYIYVVQIHVEASQLIYDIYQLTGFYTNVDVTQATLTGPIQVNN